SKVDSKRIRLFGTGGFDQTIRIWNEEGKVFHTIRNFLYPITSITYIGHSSTFWVCAGLSYAKIFDLQTAEDVTSFCATFDGWEDKTFRLKQVKFIPETNSILGSNSRRDIYMWRESHVTSVVNLIAGSAVNCLAFTLDRPSIIFTGDHKGHLLKWEKKGKHQISYDRKELNVWDSMNQKLLVKVQEKLREQGGRFRKDSLPPNLFIIPSKSTVTASGRQAKMLQLPYSEYKLNLQRSRSFLRLLYVAKLDLVVIACGDGVICKHPISSVLLCSFIDVLTYDKQSTKDLLSKVYEDQVQSQATSMAATARIFAPTDSARTTATFSQTSEDQLSALDLDFADFQDDQ
ncbi:hypothetical protein Ciccas_012653, partial [Cichlidogyrus casuarinus]